MITDCLQGLKMQKCFHQNREKQVSRCQQNLPENSKVAFSTNMWRQCCQVFSNFELYKKNWSKNQRELRSTVDQNQTVKLYSLNKQARGAAKPVRSFGWETPYKHWSGAVGKGGVGQLSSSDLIFLFRCDLPKLPVSLSPFSGNEKLACTHWIQFYGFCLFVTGIFEVRKKESQLCTKTKEKNWKKIKIEYMFRCVCIAKWDCAWERSSTKLQWMKVRSEDNK